ncbi:MAG: nucleotidyltransferase [Verrucomicrobia bacterium]|nr:MAG: nucleotidyltransferase [Verrucomicrobiota bacterium]
MKSTITQAVILMAGSGSRLRGADETFLKPLVPVLGRPLVSYTIDGLVRAGVEIIKAVVGFQSERLSAAVKGLIPRGIELELIENREWQKQNGISVLAAKNHVTAPFLLTMSDHLFDASIVDLLLRSANPNLLNVAIDRKLSSIFDLADAMKLQTKQDRIVAIGKNLAQYDAIDIGLFVCPLEIFDYLERAKRDDDCSLADGVRAMADDDKARGIDIGNAWWQDVDTPEMLSEAERHLHEGRATRSVSAQA